MTADDGVVTRWIERLKAGDASAGEQIWARYFSELVRLARRRLDGVPRRAADEEDVVLSALDSFYRGVERGRFPELRDRDDLWRLLVVITARKAADQRAREGSKKRGGDGVRALAAADVDLEALTSEAPTPELVAEVTDACEVLLRRLADPLLEKVALLRLEGLTTEEIAAELGCVPRTIERKLQLIRLKWSSEEP